MRRLAAGFLATCLLVASAGATTAQEPSPSPEPAGQRVEVPEAGIAVTFPAGWRVETESQGLPIFERVLTARQVGGPGRCLVETFRFEGVRPVEIADTLGTIWGYRKSQNAPVIELPGGEAARLYAPEALKGQAGSSDTYVFDTDDGYAWLSCSTTGPYPGHLWYSIAESIEFSPTEEEMPDEAVALPTCRDMKQAFERDFTTGHVRQDAEYLTRCVTCEELFDLVNFARVADIEMGMAVPSERCDWPRTRP